MQNRNDCDFILILKFFFFEFELYVLRCTIIKREIYVIY